MQSLLRRPAAESPVRKGRGFAVGVLTSLGNPEAGVVAVSLVPQFVTADGPVLLSAIGLGLVWAGVSGAWFSI
ncbi:hypothetical protein [Paractinoplanes lichenicola]|uniref:hypothetical protein n=1 Tax=Paractinoplanes lichenicola TaxID=2802976 RepID=UPI001F2F2D29|nr:hypothetical protein [Actinoplanes lichenicola]